MNNCGMKQSYQRQYPKEHKQSYNRIKYNTKGARTVLTLKVLEYKNISYEIFILIILEHLSLSLRSSFHITYYFYESWFPYLLKIMSINPYK